MVRVTIFSFVVADSVEISHVAADQDTLCTINSYIYINTTRLEGPMGMSSTSKSVWLGEVT
jgi:hypothetical protein